MRMKTSHWFLVVQQLHHVDKEVASVLASIQKDNFLFSPGLKDVWT